ncbi:hypothetical protein ACH58_25955 [Achromobacter xylosoxidans]|nr:hypothetical protein ACH58_25955 [Achromobacter xylosoxidans]
MGSELLAELHKRRIDILLAPKVQVHCKVDPTHHYLILAPLGDLCFGQRQLFGNFLQKMACDPWKVGSRKDILSIQKTIW